MMRHLGARRSDTEAAMKNHDIVITSYDTFRIDFEKMNSVNWCCAIFDEVHKIKGRKTKLAQTAKDLTTQRRFGLTGTVIQNKFVDFTLFINIITSSPSEL
jgi:SNF2 family DNA or RNA helicase